MSNRKNRIDDLFSESREGNLLSIFYTAGWPTLNDTVDLANAIQDGGGDMIEIGIPFSDPIADGPTIQESSQLALENGMCIELLFEQLIELRNKVTISVLLMGYLNPILQYGFEKFCAMAQTCGIDGLIIPDLPPSIYIAEYSEIAKLYNLHFIYLITPQTSDQRIKTFDRTGSGFIYAISSASTTGSNKDLSESSDYFDRLKSLQLNNPILAGFNIKTNEDLNFVNKYNQGGIVGSAFLKAVWNSSNHLATAKQFVHHLKYGA